MSVQKDKLGSNYDMILIIMVSKNFGITQQDDHGNHVFLFL